MARRGSLVPVVLVGALLLCSVGIGALALAGTVLMLIPTQPSVVADLHPPVERREGRRLDPSRCGLNQDPRGPTCVDVSAEVVEHEVTFPSRLTDKGVAELFGTLSVPQGLGPRPGVVIVHGSGPNTRDGPVPGDLVARFDPPFEVYRALADELAAQGLVVLRYDKRTSKPYRGRIDMKRFAFSDFVDDAKDGLDFLATRPEVDGRALVVLGHSQGGQLAPHIAHGDERVAAVILLGGSTQTFGHLAIEQLQRFGEVRKHQWDYLTQWALLPTIWPLKACFQPIWDGSYTPDAECLGGGVTQQMLADYEALAARTPALLADLDAPVMGIQGSVDINIDPLEIPRMAALTEGRDAEWHYVRGLDHSLTDQLDPSDPVRIDEEALARIGRFLRTVPWRAPTAAEAPGSDGSPGGR